MIEFFRIIYNAPRCDSDIIVYSGQKRVMEEIGEHLTNFSFLSTTVIPNVALEHIDKTVGCCLYQIRVPAGTPMLPYINIDEVKDSFDSSQLDTEFEIILPPLCYFTIIKQYEVTKDYIHPFGENKPYFITMKTLREHSITKEDTTKGFEVSYNDFNNPIIFNDNFYNLMGYRIDEEDTTSESNNSESNNNSNTENDDIWSNDYTWTEYVVENTQKDTDFKTLIDKYTDYLKMENEYLMNIVNRKLKNEMNKYLEVLNSDELNVDIKPYYSSSDLGKYNTRYNTHRMHSIVEWFNREKGY